jgi:hypothetical protein
MDKRSSVLDIKKIMVGQEIYDEIEESKQSTDSDVNYNAALALAECNCDSRKEDELEKKKIQTEISLAYEEIIQLEQALIELDEQNTLNALEIKKREAKIFILER